MYYLILLLVISILSLSAL